MRLVVHARSREARGTRIYILQADSRLNFKIGLEEIFDASETNCSCARVTLSFQPMPMDYSEIVRIFVSLPLVQALPDGVLDRIIRGVGLTTLTPGESFPLEAKEACLLFVLSGRVTLSNLADGSSRNLETPAAVFIGGEPATFDNRLSLTGDGDAIVGSISKKELDEIADENPAARFAIGHLINATLERETLNASLRDDELLGGMSETFRLALEELLDPVTLYGGEFLYRKGDPSDSLYIVLGGRLRVLADAAERETHTSELGRGESVGELGLVTGELRRHSVCAVRDTYLARLSEAAYHRLLASHPQEVMRLFLSRVARRVEQISEGGLRTSSRINNIALIPASSGPLLEKFCAEFCEALKSYGTVARISSQRVDEAFGVKGFAQTSDWDGNRIRFMEWLSRLERNHTYVVYEADEIVTPWTERCIRQSDRIVLVGRADQDPAPGEIETELIAHLPVHSVESSTLVLIHDSRDPSGTAQWLKPRKIGRHHHVRMGSGDDFGRLARFLTGRALGLTLGGGFARGLAHIGVFRALAEAGLPLDAVGGTSMGALIGGLWASGWTYERIIHEVSDGCRDSFNDMTVPFIAFKTGRKFSDLVASFFGDVCIEDLWHPFFCVSANLNRAELVLHTQGGLTKAALASSRAPGIFPPIVYGGELHVDGGVINNVPVDLMRAFCVNGITIGVDVSPPHELEDVEDYGYTVGGWKALRSRFGLWGAKKKFVPSILLVLMRTLEFGGISYRTTREGAADILLRPPMLGFKRTDWHLANEIVEVSHRHALERIEALNGHLGERIREIRTSHS